MTLKAHPLVLVVACAFVVSCASTQYHAWEGSPITAGSGGAKETVEGIDVWVAGKPARKHKVIGYIEDERGAGYFPMKSLKADLAKLARQNGGDAVVMLESSNSVSGIMQGQGTYNSYSGTYTPGATTVVQEHSTKALVIKYVD